MLVKLLVIVIYCRNKARGMSYWAICTMSIPSPPKSDQKKIENRKQVMKKFRIKKEISQKNKRV